MIPLHQACSRHPRYNGPSFGKERVAICVYHVQRAGANKLLAMYPTIVLVGEIPSFWWVKSQVLVETPQPSKHDINFWCISP